MKKLSKEKISFESLKGSFNNIPQKLNGLKKGKLNNDLMKISN